MRLYIDMIKNLVILGSTGSIGRQTLEVIDLHRDDFVVRALAAYSNVDLLVEQYNKYRPEYIGIVDVNKAGLLKDKLKNEDVKIVVGETEIVGLTTISKVDVVVNAIVGSAGLLASLETVKQGRTLALANKESLVTGGPLFSSLIKKKKAKILPIDSEHSAIWQALKAGNENEVKKIILTASGGPFREYPAEKFEDITKEMALNHPTWNMGDKITIDSATLANKALEVIEAVILFSVPAEKIEVVIHPQSIIHSMVEFVDSSIIAQLSQPDMRLPISYALYWPERKQSGFGNLNWKDVSKLTFEQPDYNKFKALKLGFDAAKAGGTAPAIFNAANEIAVNAFLGERIKFTEIADIIDDSLQNIEYVADPSLDNILETDRQVRTYSEKIIKELVC